MVMEYVDGQDLVSRMKEQGLPSVADSINYVKQAAGGLAHAHEQQVFHRNVKPSNLMIDRHGVVKVVGMGLARLGENPEIGEEVQITHAGDQLGSCDFMAPEQANDSHEIDQRADIYSLGCTLYFLLTGKLVYPGKGAMEKLLAHRSAPIPSLRDPRARRRPSTWTSCSKRWWPSIPKTAFKRCVRCWRRSTRPRLPAERRSPRRWMASWMSWPPGRVGGE